MGSGPSDKGWFFDGPGIQILAAVLVICGIGFSVLFFRQIINNGGAEAVGTKMLADQGDPAAELALGKAYQDGRGVPQDDAQGLTWILKAAISDRPGNHPAQGYLCYMYLFGYHIGKDLAQAGGWCDKAAQAGNAQGMELEGYMYQYGQGKPQDFALAADWHEKAAAAGDQYSKLMLAGMYQLGEGRPKDIAKALELTKEAAATGLPQAEMALGSDYEFGAGVPQDHGLAIAWYRKAADQHWAPAGCELASLHFTKGAASIADSEALHWLDEGAKRQDTECMNNYAWLLATASNSALRDPTRAETLIDGALMKAPDDPGVMDTRAAVYAAEGRYTQAVLEQQQAMSKLKDDAASQAGRKRMQERLALYQAGKPYVDAGPAATTGSAAQAAGNPQ